MKGMNLFKKNLPAMSLMFAFCFLIAAMVLVTREVTGTELNETNISAHVNAQKQALSAISSGVEQLERSCIYSDEQSGLSNQLKNFSLEVDADFEKIREIRSEEKIKSQELLQNQPIIIPNHVTYFQHYWIQKTHQQLAEKQGGQNRILSSLHLQL